MWWLLPIFLISLGLFVYIIFSTNPDAPIQLSAKDKFTLSPTEELPALPVFFLLFFLTITSLFGFLLNSLRRGIFVGLFVVGFLLLRYYHLTQIIFITLLIAIFAAFELFFLSRK